LQKSAFLQKSVFFAKNLLAKIGVFHEKFADFFKNADFLKNTDLCKNWKAAVKFAKNWIFAKMVFFYPKTNFCKNVFAKIFAMSAALSPWDKGFKSRFLGKSEVCGIFCCIPQKSCFLTTPKTD
jgi:hypothetical protein